jgi:putative FmdB family regulatory protein
MPTYEYRCSACEHKWEEFESITSKPMEKCPSCRKKKAERMISAGGGIIFKGTGFYQTDYRSENYKKGAKAESKANETKTESKAETKTESKSDSSSKASDSGSSSSSKD